MKNEYKGKGEQKDNQITDLKNKMADLSIQFSKMLKETLEKLQERIELQHWDNESIMNEPTMSLILSWRKR